MLVAVPLALFVYLSVQSRYFGRWLLPAYPALAMLGASALARASERRCPRADRRGPGRRFRGLDRRRGAGRPHRARARAAARGRRAQRAGARPRGHPPAGARLARVDSYPPELRVAIEPAVPGRWFRSNPEGDPPSWLEPLRSAATAGPSRAGPTRRDRRPARLRAVQAGPRSRARTVACAPPPTTAVLGPEVIDDYRLYGYCLVMTVDVVRDRALETGDPAGARLLRAPGPRVAPGARVQPLRRGRRPRAVQLRPLLQLLPARVPPAGADGARLPARRLPQASGPPVIRIPQARGAAAGVSLAGRRRAEGPAASSACSGRTAVPLRRPSSQSVAYCAYIRPRSAHQVPTGSGPPLQDPAE